MKYSREQKLTILLSILITVAGLVIYWTSAYPSVTWWESSEYSTAAVTLGITGPPGSLMLTILGWLVTKLSSGDPAFYHNLLSGLIGTLAVLILFHTYRRINKISGSEELISFNWSALVIYLLVALVILTGLTLWQYSVMFAPYILTGLFTTFVVFVFLEWWMKAEDSDSWKIILLLTLLLGLDFSVHRTNAVLIPGLVIAMLLRYPRFLADYRSWLAALAGFLAGLSFQLLYIPVARLDPSLNFGEPSTLKAFWSYFSLEQYGGNFLLDIFKRKAPLFAYQVPYYLKAFSDNFLNPEKANYFTGLIPGILGFAGIISLFRKNRKLAVSLITLFVVTAAFSVIYFNLPQNYFRQIYRHYIPSFIIFSIFIFEGAAFLLVSIKRIFKGPATGAVILIFILLITAFARYSGNLKRTSGRSDNLTTEYIENIMKSVAPNAIIFSYYDNEYWPFLYLQAASKIRPDIDHMNLSLLNLKWYIGQMRRFHRGVPYSGDGIDPDKFEYTGWKARKAFIQVPGPVALNANLRNDTLEFELPAIRENNSNYLQDLVLFDVICNNGFSRPVYLVKNGLEPEVYKWLQPFLSDEGLVYRFIPGGGVKVDFPAVIADLESFDFTGFADSRVRLDEMSITVGKRYTELFVYAARYLINTGDKAGASALINKLLKELPPGRINPDGEILKSIEEIELLTSKN